LERALQKNREKAAALLKKVTVLGQKNSLYVEKNKPEKGTKRADQAKQQAERERDAQMNSPDLLTRKMCMEKFFKVHQISQ
jgi:hypothetical protein